MAKWPERISISKRLQNLIDKADINVCNFECPIERQEQNPVIKSGPTLCQSEKSPELLEQIGFNVITLANNHIMDYGADGCLATIDAFKKSVTVGAGYAKNAFSVRIVEVKGYKIGFFSITQHEFGTLDFSDCNRIGVAWFNSLDISNIITVAKSNIDYLVVLPHAGVENVNAPLPQIRSLYRKYIDWGADVVIASHPHVPQGWENYKGKVIAYSLGNFYFDCLNDGALWNNSLCATLNITGTVEVEFRNIKVEKTYIDIDNSNEILKHTEFLNSLLNDKERYNSYISSVCKDLYPSVRYGILRGVCGVSLKFNLRKIIRLLGCMILNNKDEMYLLNSYQCESHRWVIENYLNNKYKL